MNPLALRIGPDTLFRFLFGGIFGFVGVGMLIGATIFYLNTQNFTKHAMNAPGTVVSLQRSVSRSSKGGTSTTYAPVVEYTAADGQTRTFTSSLSSSPPAYQTGQPVKVLYDPAPPYKAEINDFMSMYFLPVLLGIMGTIFTTIGGCVAFMGSRRVAHLPQGPVIIRH
jgi:hypothetical protein